jgi:hypothetical protein
MPRYYFDLHNGDGPLKDNDGLEIASRDGVAKEVSRILADIARDEMPAQDKNVISLKVRNEAGKVISISSLTFFTEWLD